jgi:hypothetical protein
MNSLGKRYSLSWNLAAQGWILDIMDPKSILYLSLSSGLLKTGNGPMYGEVILSFFPSTLRYGVEWTRTISWLGASGSTGLRLFQLTSVWYALASFSTL